MVHATREAIQSYKLGYDRYALRIEATDRYPGEGSHFGLLFFLSNSRGSALLGKKVVLQPVKKFPTFHGTRKCITMFTAVHYLSLS